MHETLRFAAMQALMNKSRALAYGDGPGGSSWSTGLKDKATAAEIVRHATETSGLLGNRGIETANLPDAFAKATQAYMAACTEWGRRTETTKDIWEEAEVISKHALTTTLETHFVRNFKDKPSSEWKGSFSKYWRKYNASVDDDDLATAVLTLYKKYRQ